MGNYFKTVAVRLDEFWRSGFLAAGASLEVWGHYLAKCRGLEPLGSGNAHDKMARKTLAFPALLVSLCRRMARLP